MMTMALDHLSELVREVMESCAGTDHSYHKNFRSGVTTFPIPFFGNLASAKVLTIGVNPSADEFVNRDWPKSIDCHALAWRLLHYFELHPGPHPWFSAWEEALELLGISYSRGDAAHLDLSPRATIEMSAVPDTNLFLGMVSQDIRWLFRALRECSSARLVTIAGTVTARWYINQFLAAHAAQHKFSILPPPQASDRCALYEMTYLDKKLPLFFSSVSPSDPKRAHVLIENVRKNCDRLRAHLN